MAKENTNKPNLDIVDTLNKAISNNDIAKVESLLKHGAKDSVNTPNQDGVNPLLQAVINNNPAMVRLLLLNGAKTSVNTQNKLGNTPLVYAIWNNNAEIAKLLLECGAKDRVNTQEQLRSTPLHKAIASKNLEIVKLLLEYGAKDSVNTQDGYEITPLYMAIWNNNSEIVKLLLEYGADADLNILKSFFISKIHPHIIFDLCTYNAKNNNSSPTVLFVSLVNYFNCFTEDKSINFNKLLDIFIENIDYFDLTIISSVKEGNELLQQDEKFNSIVNNLKKSFSQDEVRKCHNLHKIIKSFDDKYKIDLLNNLLSKYAFLFSNYNYLKNYFTSDTQKAALNICEQSLNFNETELGIFEANLCFDKFFEELKTFTIKTINPNNSTNSGSLDFDDEKSVMTHNNKTKTTTSTISSNLSHQTSHPPQDEHNVSTNGDAPDYTGYNLD